MTQGVMFRLVLPPLSSLDRVVPDLPTTSNKVVYSIYPREQKLNMKLYFNLYKWTELLFVRVRDTKYQIYPSIIGQDGRTKFKIL